MKLHTYTIIFLIGMGCSTLSFEDQMLIAGANEGDLTSQYFLGVKLINDETRIFQNYPSNKKMMIGYTYLCAASEKGHSRSIAAKNKYSDLFTPEQRVQAELNAFEFWRNKEK